MIPGSSPTEVSLVYHVTEGKQVEVAKVLLTGYQFTRPGIIARQVDIEAGGPLREGDVAKTQRQLYNLGVFNRVQIAPQNPDGTDPDKAVVVAMQEGQRYTIGYGFGFEVQRIAGGSTNPNGTTIGASPRGIFEIARNNMFGRAQTLIVQGARQHAGIPRGARLHRGQFSDRPESEPSAHRLRGQNTGRQYVHFHPIRGRRCRWCRSLRPPARCSIAISTGA